MYRQRRLISEITSFDGVIGNRLGHQRDAGLQLIALGTADTDGIALNRRLYLQFGILDHFDDLLGQFAVDTDLDLQILLDLVTGNLLNRLMIETLDAFLLFFFHGRKQDVLDLIQLEIRIAVQRDDLVLFVEVDLGRRSFEVVARIDLTVGHINGVLQGDKV